MKVRCIRLIDTIGKPQSKSDWLTIGKTYHVLEIIQSPDCKWKFRLLGDGFTGVALFALEEFEIVSPKIPDTWIAVWHKDDSFALRPAAWNVPGFWERYYDRDPRAIQLFEEEKSSTINADL